MAHQATAGEPWVCLCRLAYLHLSLLGSTPGRPSSRDKGQDTCFHRNTANPVQGRGLFAQVLAMGQDAFHTADFTANSTAWHRLEVRAVSQGLCSKFL